MTDSLSSTFFNKVKKYENALKNSSFNNRLIYKNNNDNDLVTLPTGTCTNQSPS